MAGRYANIDAQRSLKKLNGEVVVDKQDNKDFVNIAKAHASAGNMGDMVTIMSALSRFEQTNDVTVAIKEQNAEDRKVLLAEIDARMGTDVAISAIKSNPVEEVMPPWAEQLFKRIAAMEKK